MRRWLLATLLVATMLCIALPVIAQEAKPATLKSVLLDQLHDTHDQKAWFVSEKEAVAGLTPEQAAWTDGKNHSVGQLVQHLNYWNTSNLDKMKGRAAGKTIANNDDTFKYDPKQWSAALKQFDDVMTEFEHFVQSADDATLAKIAPTIARICEHNAYHIGEMVMVRKAQGSWNPENGVK